MVRTARRSRLATLLMAGLPLVAVGTVAVRSAHAQSPKLPEGATASMVEEGRQIFKGAGNCFTCHGENAEGTPIAPNLTDEKWLHIDGSYDAIVKLVTSGVPQPKEAMVPMLPRGGAELTADQVRAVAAYVWTLCRGGPAGDGKKTCTP
jgi:mono/diheme cytochrome c family protein